MTTFGRSDDLKSARFEGVNLRGARFVGSDLSGIVMRGVDVNGADVDSPWLLEGGATFFINGIDVAPLVEAELNRRFPGRGNRLATDPAGLRVAWESLQSAWASVLDRAAAMPTGTVDRSVDGEWSFAQTLRHLVFATDVWLRSTVMQLDQPYHPLGLTYSSAAAHGFDMSVFATTEPSYDEVVEARAGRVVMVRDFLADVTNDGLDERRTDPWAPEHQLTVRSCLHVILGEEWDHLRYAQRDLDTIGAGLAAG